MLRTARTFLPHIRVVLRSWEPVNVAASVQLQQVRWRKRRTDPKAKSKIGRIREPTPVDPWERAFSKEKMPHYRSTLRAIRKLFKEEIVRKDEMAEELSRVEQEQEAQEEFRRLLLWNEEENAKIAIRRKEKLERRAKEAEEENLQWLLMKEEREAEETRKLTELVLQEKEASKSFITIESMDAAIEEALDNPKNYNFPLKRTGEPLFPEDTAWQKFSARAHEAHQQELVEDDVKSSEN